MSVHWLIEVGVFEKTAGPICRALDSRGQAWTRYHDEINARELPETDQPVIFWGSLGAAYAERVADRWSPGALGDVSRFACSTYFAELDGIAFANSDAVITTVAELVAAPTYVTASLGASDRAFVRPDSPLKPFAGRELALSEISLAALDHGFYYEDENLPIVVSSAKHVRREWRFVVADGIVVAGCEYQDSREGVSTDVPDGPRAVAATVAEAAWQAAALYVVDVGEVDDDYRVMELNPFSGADLYHCDPDAVVDAATRTAQRLFDTK